MAGKKDKTVVSVITGLTSRQASEIVKDLMKSKAKNAPLSRGTAAIRNETSISNFLNGTMKKLLKK